VIVDAHDFLPDSEHRADVCIIGGGAAGITLALELSASGKEVLLLESGGLAYEEETQELYGGIAQGTFLDSKEQYLSRSRVRRFGGSTNHWNGWCAALEKADFEDVSWSDYHRWPISRSDLDPFYKRAADYLDIRPGFDDTPSYWTDDPVYQPFFFSLSPPTRFDQKYRQSLKENPRVRVILHANVTELRADNNPGRVSGVTASTMNHHRFSVQAEEYVLACGGVENARLLMVSNQGTGMVHTASEALGRFFMDHPITRIGHAAVAHGRKTIMKGFDDFKRPNFRGARRGLLRPRPDVRDEKGWQNAVVVLQREGRWKAGSYAKWVDPAGVKNAQLAGVPGRVEGESYFASLKIATEQTPNRESRLELLPARDALGMQRVRLRWRILDRDATALEQMIDSLRRRFGARLEGRMRSTVVAGAPWEKANGSNHHMGTTRMASSVVEGVVDANCKVIDVENLHIAGSSVFPTSGAVNPTFTIVALAVRLADHLGAQS